MKRVAALVVVLAVASLLPVVPSKGWAAGYACYLMHRSVPVK